MLRRLFDYTSADLLSCCCRCRLHTTPADFAAVIDAAIAADALLMLQLFC